MLQDTTITSTEANKLSTNYYYFWKRLIQKLLLFHLYFCSSHMHVSSVYTHKHSSWCACVYACVCTCKRVCLSVARRLSPGIAVPPQCVCMVVDSVDGNV